MNELLQVTASSPEIKDHVQTLSLVQALLNELHNHNISYCHWKSNEHLGASMTGDTDLDILFDYHHKAKLETILENLAFKRFASIRQKQYKDIEDFLGIDLESGKLIHLHAHFRLTLGENYLKGYQLDIEETILQTRVYNSQYGIYCSSPAFELVLLFIREALKVRLRDTIKVRLFGRHRYTGNILVEYNWLKERVADMDISNALKTIFVNYKPIYEIVTGPLDKRQIIKLSGILREEFKSKRLYSTSQALLLRWYREFTVKFLRALARLTDQPVASQRVNPRGGLCIAFIGADGSGKSTITANLQSTFNTKLDVYKIYFGRGDGKKSLARRLLLKIKAVLVPSRRRQNSDSVKIDSSPSSRGFLVNLFKCLEALTVAAEKNANLTRMQKARKLGMLVICDRFPQNQLMGYNDGPLLSYLRHSTNPLFKAISHLEAKVYEKAAHTIPDILFKLIADADIVAARKPGETSLDALEIKINGIRKLWFDDSCHVEVVDSTRPLQEVLNTVKRVTWTAYQ